MDGTSNICAYWRTLTKNDILYGNWLHFAIEHTPFIVVLHLFTHLKWWFSKNCKRLPEDTLFLNGGSQKQGLQQYLVNWFKISKGFLVPSELFQMLTWLQCYPPKVSIVLPESATWGVCPSDFQMGEEKMFFWYGNISGWWFQTGFNPSEKY